MRNGSNKLLAMLCVLGCTIMIAEDASATVLSFTADIEYSGGREPVGAAPWLTATFDDHGGNGLVTLTLAATNLTSNEFVSRWYLNLDPLLDPDDLVFSSPTKVGNFYKPSISLGENDYKAAGGGKYDIKFEFATSGGEYNRFGSDDSVSYTITGIPSLMALSFAYPSSPSGGNGTFYMAAHVQGIGRCAEDSGWVGADWSPEAPEPATLGFMVIGSLVLLFRRK